MAKAVFPLFIFEILLNRIFNLPHEFITSVP